MVIFHVTQCDLKNFVGLKVSFLRLVYLRIVELFMKELGVQATIQFTMGLFAQLFWLIV